MGRCVRGAAQHLGHCAPVGPLARGVHAPSIRSAKAIIICGEPAARWFSTVSVQSPTCNLPAVRRELIADVRRLWRECDHIAATDVDEGWRRFVSGAAKLLEAPGGGFAVLYSRRGGAEDPFAGWLPVHALEEGLDADLRMKIKAAWITDPECQVDDSVARMFAAGGSTRVMRTRDIEPEAERWERSPSRRLIEAHGLRDRIIGAYAIDERTEVHFVFDRRRAQSDFSEADRAILEVMLSGIGRLCRWLALSYGVYPQGSRISPRQREALQHLLTGEAEKNIADRMGLKQSSLHQIVVELYRRFGVQSRPELMAMWLGGETDGPTPD